MKFSKVHSILLIAALLLGGIVFSSILHPVSAQTAQPTSTTTPVSPSTPTDPQIQALQSTIATQQVQIDQLQRDHLQEVKDRQFDVRDLLWKWGIAVAVVTAVMSILTWVGRNSLQNLQKDWEYRSEKILNRAIYKLDLSNLRIYLPVDENSKDIRRLLLQRKFENIQLYGDFNEFKNGILIVSLKGKDETQQTEILDNFKSFIDTQKPSPANAGFIVYCPDGIKVPPKIMGCHENLVTANYLSTVISSIFTVGRGIEIVPSK